MNAANMLTKKASMCFDLVAKQNNKANSQFIMNVREEDRRDRILEDVFMRSTEENPYTKQIEANIALCTAIAEEKHSQQTAERRKMVRRRTNPDLQELEYKLRAAYISKAVGAQSFEEKQLAAEEKTRTHKENQGLQAARLRNQEYVKRRVTQTQEKKNALKRDLQAQMALTKAKHQRESLSKMEDRKQMDETVRQFKEELMKKEQVLCEEKTRIRKEMDEVKALQAKWKTDYTDDEKEQRRYEQLAALREEAIRKYRQEQKELQVRRALKSEEMGKENHKIAELKRKSFDFLTDLLIDERKANEDLKSARDNERKSRERMKFRNDLIDQHRLKKKKEMDEKREEEKLHREVTRLLEEQDAKQRIKDEKNRQDAEAHRKTLLDALTEKKRLRVNEMKRLLRVESNEQAESLRKQVEIDKARAEMIGEHAPALMGFLVPQVAREGNNIKKKI